jgi:methionine-rich copper-binding protein CopC
MHTRIRRSLLIAVLVAGVVAVFGTAPASAHVTVVSKSPASSAKKTIKTVRVTFSGALRSGTLKVYRVSNGVKYSIGNGGRNPRNLKQLVCSLKTVKPAVQYVARWTLVGADGHAQHGSWRFRLTN